LVAALGVRGQILLVALEEAVVVAVRVMEQALSQAGQERLVRGLTEELAILRT
jgi:hypothetical protein